ncbi:ComF family protein [Peribacillus cavernae]|uniref:ComF family protein n=1 Tax=Peribacillus cavernae TaxID=1674310 RepID=A0A3S1BA04_9BACI|nr:ComF family protein [Peribacillus cavernae]MDQ0218424.1 competence protein ComFC [Peribacillus cavernae]RUQ31426.1 ComF family protein [Peribacillus cavernae]
MFKRRNCIICDEEIQSPFTWKSIWTGTEDEKVCEDCNGKLSLITGEACQYCSRVLHDKYRQGPLCLDCVRWENDKEWSGYLEKNTSIFHYNDFLKEVIAKFKYRGDYALAEVFAPFVKEKLRDDHFDLVIPIPLSDERLKERGFNQAEAIAATATLETFDALLRIHTEKQSKKSRKERISLAQVFQVKDTKLVDGKKILLIDDIYTTGSTLRHAAKALKQSGATEITSLTLAR